MGGTALIAASKCVHVCVLGEAEEKEGECVGGWVGATVWVWV